MTASACAPRRGARDLVATVFLSILLVLFASCVTPGGGDDASDLHAGAGVDAGQNAGQDAGSPSSLDALYAGVAVSVREVRAGDGGTVAVTTYVIPRGTARVIVEARRASDGQLASASPLTSPAPQPPSSLAIEIGATPWRVGHHSDWPLGREPVGVVVDGNGTHLSPPAPPYWAVVFDAEPRLLAQADLARGAVGRGGAVDTLGPGGAAGSGDAVLSGGAAGGFFPLVLARGAVATDYPGTRIRAARVALGWRASDRSWIIVVTGGSRLTGPPGLTTPELARELEATGVDWAINLDGGRSAFVAVTGLPSPRGLPVLRRAGPVRVRIDAGQREGGRTTIWPPR